MAGVSGNGRGLWEQHEGGEDEQGHPWGRPSRRRLCLEPQALRQEGDVNSAEVPGPQPPCLWNGPWILTYRWAEGGEQAVAGAAVAGGDRKPM